MLQMRCTRHITQHSQIYRIECCIIPLIHIHVHVPSCPSHRSWCPLRAHSPCTGRPCSLRAWRQLQRISSHGSWVHTTCTKWIPLGTTEKKSLTARMWCNVRSAPRCLLYLPIGLSLFCQIKSVLDCYMYKMYDCFQHGQCCITVIPWVLYLYCTLNHKWGSWLSITAQPEILVVIQNNIRCFCPQRIFKCYDLVDAKNDH